MVIGVASGEAVKDCLGATSNIASVGRTDLG